MMSMMYINIYVSFLQPILLLLWIVHPYACQLLETIPKDIEPLLSRMLKGTKVKIAKANEGLVVDGHQPIAKVIKHTDRDSRLARTVIIHNTPEAFRAFGVRNAPGDVYEKSENASKALRVANDQDALEGKRDGDTPEEDSNKEVKSKDATTM